MRNSKEDSNQIYSEKKRRLILSRCEIYWRNTTLAVGNPHYYGDSVKVK